MSYTRELLDAPGAVCLDGSAGALYYRGGHGSGANKWYVHYEGGGWCTNLDECLGRSRTVLGSSLTYPEVMVPYQDRGYFNTSVAYFSPDPSINPTMYNWNSVFLRCAWLSPSNWQLGAIPDTTGPVRGRL